MNRPFFVLLAAIACGAPVAASASGDTCERTLHITRRALWSDAGGPAIGAAEWRRYLSVDPEISRLARGRHAYRVSLPEERFVLNYDPRRGDFSARVKRCESADKLWRIAMSLKAGVQDDDGTGYNSEP